ncbi:hypothetical protein PGR6_10740 [Pseudomonas sp. GR 6-02]|nr:hypothetical protein PGR6_10740 [Pseudomonas sp. GR 6-02]
MRGEAADESVMDQDWPWVKAQGSHERRLFVTPKKISAASL